MWKKRGNFKNTLERQKSRLEQMENFPYHWKELLLSFIFQKFIVFKWPQKYIGSLFWDRKVYSKVYLREKLVKIKPNKKEPYCYYTLSRFAKMRKLTTLKVKSL